MVEHKDATEAERAVRLCNSGMMAAKARDLFALLARVTDDNAAKEYYLVDIVNIANADGRSCVVVKTDPDDVAGINSRAELAQAGAQWQAFKREEAMAGGASLRAPIPSGFRGYRTRPRRDGRTERLFRSRRDGRRQGDDPRQLPYRRCDNRRGMRRRPLRAAAPGTVLGGEDRQFRRNQKAVLGKGAKASHLTYLGDVSVGAGANIGAGTITCNYDGYFKYKTEIGENAFIARTAHGRPVKIGRDAIVGAGSTVTADVMDGELRLVRAEQSRSPAGPTASTTMRKKKAAEKKA
jgi:bifunctional UDP-N-acetylglucosamine pyrophosphorylase/glucosamine-1-phosphate N-acetyltransferase